MEQARITGSHAGRMHASSLRLGFMLDVLTHILLGEDVIVPNVVGWFVQDKGLILKSIMFIYSLLFG